MLALQIIIGSTRDGRAADHVTPWLVDRATRHGAFAVDVLDLRDWPLPMFAETSGTIGDPADPTYSDPIVKRWNQTIKAGEAYVMVTPEYNHSTTAVLKNAIDSVFVSNGFRNKPATFVSYGGGTTGGVRAIEHLAHIAIELELMPLRNTVVVPRVTSAFEGTDPKDPLLDARLTIALDDLAWFGEALRRARAGGELPHGNARLRAAMAALAVRRAPSS